MLENPAGLELGFSRSPVTTSFSSLCRAGCIENSRFLMEENHHYSSRSDSKRKFDDQGAPPSPVAPASGRRPTGFSSPVTSLSSGTAAPTSYNNVHPPPDGIELAKQRAQEIAARLFSDAEAKRPRVENGGADDSKDKGFRFDQSSKPIGSTISSQVGMTPQMPYSSYGYPGSSKKIDIPNGRVGVIIGKNGETIKYLQVQSGAKIQVTRDMDADPNSHTRCVELIGTPEQINKAEQLVNDVLAEAEVGTSSTRKFATTPVGAEHFSMKIPNNKVGLIIGKGGESIRNMQATSGARIQVNTTIF
ncbi:hypothetical protein KSP40_PGU000101 [Platanthera guangdongensis]|uniref:K Homology domain-containing protein n=1 Tax=Platanthera guangdongensis TaxID=2320717 RepID=A0ABR2LF35_9ASPA